MLLTVFFAAVIGISDGDTLTVLHEQQQIKVRLAEIDAPEKAQAFGARAKQSLSDLCFGKQAEVVPQSSDRYGRTVARVRCDGIDANAEQVRRGMAWVFDRYVTDRSLYALQDEARTARRGLWSDPAPVPPWEWRREWRHMMR
jgi:micrococcal nuclease